MDLVGGVVCVEFGEGGAFGGVEVAADAFDGGDGVEEVVFGPGGEVVVGEVAGGGLDVDQGEHVFDDMADH